MKNKNVIFLLAGLLLGSMVINSCKKDDKSSINTLLTTGNWQLASVMAFHYLGSTQTAADTLNTSCDTSQVFTFNNNSTCTYTNYHCVPQPTAHGTWIITGDKLFLECLITCKDTLPGGAGITDAKAFVYTKILSLGPYSMIVQTGDIGGYYTSTTRRTVYQYGFVHVKASTN